MGLNARLLADWLVDRLYRQGKGAFNKDIKQLSICVTRRLLQLEPRILEELRRRRPVLRPPLKHPPDEGEELGFLFSLEVLLFLLETGRRQFFGELEGACDGTLVVVSWPAHDMWVRGGTTCRRG